MGKPDFNNLEVKHAEMDAFVHLWKLICTVRIMGFCFKNVRGERVYSKRVCMNERPVCKVLGPGLPAMDAELYRAG